MAENVANSISELRGKEWREEWRRGVRGRGGEEGGDRQSVLYTGNKTRTPELKRSLSAGEASNPPRSNPRAVTPWK